MNSYKFVPENRRTSFGTVKDAVQLFLVYNGREDDRFNTINGAVSANYRPNDKIEIKNIFSSYFAHLSYTNSEVIKNKIVIAILNRAVKRGGNWNNGANAGPFCANLNNGPTNTNYNIGFRCCSASS